MRFEKRRLPLGVALIAAIMAVVVSGCGSGSSATGVVTSGGEATTTPAPENATVAFPAPIQSLNPATAVDAAGLSVLNLIGVNLYELEGEKVVPGIASKGTESGDGLSWTFQLRPNLKFSDGSPLDAEDVVASIEAVRKDPTSFYGGVTEPIERATAKGADTVVVSLSRPYPSLSKVLAEPLMTIFPADALKQKSFHDDPISAGRYELKSWGGTETAVLVRNPDFWGKAPGISKLTLTTVADPNTRLQQVETDQINLAYSLPPEAVSEVRPPLSATVVPMYGHESLSMRSTEPPFDELGVRKAVSAALDRDKMSETVWGGKVKPLAGFWPSTMAGYDPSISTQANIEEAKEYLKGTSCENGCKVTLTYSSSAFPQGRLEALLIQSELGEIGIDVQLKDIDATSWYTELGEFKLQMTLVPIYDFLDVPDTLLQYGLLPEGGQEANYTGFSTPGIEAAAEEATTNTGAKREAGLKKVNELFVKYATYATLTDTATIYVSNLSPDVLSVAKTTLLVVGDE